MFEVNNIGDQGRSLDCKGKGKSWIMVVNLINLLII